MQNQKSLLDHQIAELKKRIDEVEDASSTYKAQLAQQKQLEQQQNQINANEIQKLQNTI
jgi:lipid II:glycine glycyltransferase (peptidoglycan interpeptide bridge formation enzyme)